MTHDTQTDGGSVPNNLVTPVAVATVSSATRRLERETRRGSS